MTQRESTHASGAAAGLAPFLLLALLLANAVEAAPTVTLRPVASSLASPVEVANAGDGSGRLFIAEQAGTIRIVRKTGELLPAAFLNISSLVLSGDERGLLGLAFHPQYAANRKFYVFYTRQPDGALQVSEYLASVANVDLADAASARPVITIAHPVGNHNGGHIAFGPDGYLYIGTGDGGGGGDPSNNGQNKSALLGKILRLDVNTPSGYLVPPANPFVGQDGADEVWAYGLRNPWRFSFDRQRGDLYIADVGQNAWEEINFEPAGFAGGGNYGWRVMEGNHCFNPSSGCATAGKILPILEHSHASGWAAVIGGYVYRGRKSAALRGYYIYTDLSVSTLRAASTTDFAVWSSEILVDGPALPSTFGEGEDGELYVASLSTGTLYAIDGPGPASAVAVVQDFDGDGKADLLWRHAQSGENYLYPMNGRAILGSEGLLRTVADTNWKVVGVGDFDGDGKADILWRNSSTGQNYIYFMDGTAIKPTEGYIRTVADQAWQVAGIGDFDGDGKADILWRNSSTGENYLYPMNGRAIQATEGFLRTVIDQNWQIAGVGDFDGDGKADILWRNAATGNNYLYPMNGRAIKATEGYVRTVADLNWSVAGAGDFDGDGKADILWRNSSTGENYLFPMTGNAIKPTEGYLRTVSDQNWRVASVADFDGDGKADIFWRNASTGENYIYPMDGRSIKPTEGLIRTVPVGGWNVVSR